MTLINKFKIFNLEKYLKNFINEIFSINNKLIRFHCLIIF